MEKYGIIIALTVAMSVLDILTGYLQALLRKNVSSSVMRKGLIKKGAQIIVIAVSCLLQYAQTLVDLGISIPIINATCAFLILMETTSILENADKMLNGKLKKLVDKIVKKEEGKNE